MSFCNREQIATLNPSVGEIIRFLTEMHEDGLGYSAINTAKSMLSTIFSVIHKVNIGSEPLIKLFMKGIFHLKPVLPKTNYTWDVKKVLLFMKQLDNNNITLRLLSIKLALLLILVTGQRCQTLFSINIENIEITPEYIKLRIGDILKQTRPKYHLGEIYIEPFTENVNICAVKTLECYLKKTKDIRSSTKLFIVTQKPYSGASKSTISNWIKQGLKLSGINLSIFTPHSTRGAATSAVVNKVPIDTIIKTAGWSKECIFRKFYKRPITNDSTFSDKLLS